MVDLTKLSKDELIKEFDLIISEWQRCKQQIDAYEDEKFELRRRMGKISAHTARSMKITKKKEGLNRILREREKHEETTGKTSNILGLLVVLFCMGVLGKIVLEGIRIYKGLPVDLTFFIQLFLGLIIIVCVFKIPILTKLVGWVIYFLSGEMRFDRAEKKRDELERQFRSSLNENKEYSELGRKIESLDKEIKKVNENFSKFRKRNNLAPKYYGYEHILKGYLENGTADDFKEALLRLEEAIHRNEMLNIQENMRAQISSMRRQVSSQLANQSKQLANQSSEINHLSREVSYLSNEY